MSSKSFMIHRGCKIRSNTSYRGPRHLRNNSTSKSSPGYELNWSRDNPVKPIFKMIQIGDLKTILNKQNVTFNISGKQHQLEYQSLVLRIILRCLKKYFKTVV